VGSFVISWSQSQPLEQLSTRTDSRTQLMKRLLSLIFFLILSVAILAQYDHEDHDHDDGDHFHDNEVGLSFAPVLYSGEKEQPVYFGLHGHYVKRLGESRFGAGLGVEYIFDEHRHQTYSVVIQYSPARNLHIIAAPGFAIEEDGDEHSDHGEKDAHKAVFAVHLEAFYEFELGPIDLGPAFEFAYDEHDIHYSLGLHVALPF